MFAQGHTHPNLIKIFKTLLLLTQYIYIVEKLESIGKQKENKSHRLALFTL